MLTMFIKVNMFGVFPPPSIKKYIFTKSYNLKQLQLEEVCE